jgi:hypothetical protein
MHRALDDRRVFAIFPCRSSLVIGLVIHKLDCDVDDAHDR